MFIIELIFSGGVELDSKYSNYNFNNKDIVQFIPPINTYQNHLCKRRNLNFIGGPNKWLLSVCVVVCVANKD